MSKRLGFGALLGIIAAAPALCLDSNRSLTQYMHRIWQSPQGLPPATIHSIIQSKDGYLWLGTERGLVRFDGVRFTVMSDLNPAGSEGPNIRQVLESGTNDFWIATTNAGLLRLHDRVVTHYSRNEGLPSDSIHCLVANPKGGLWVCTENGLAKLNDDKIQVIGNTKVEAACVRKDGTVWSGGDGTELSIWNGTKLSTYQLRSLPGYATVQSLLAAKDDSLWIGTTDGLIRLANGVEQRLTKVHGLANNSVLSLTESQDGSILIGTNDGFSRYRGHELESFGTKNGLSQSTVYALFEDREGSLWAGTKRGLNQFLDRRTIPITASEGLPSNDTGPVLQDLNGNIWVGTLDAGLGKYAGRHSSVLTKDNGLASDSIYSLAVDGRGGVWVGTSAGLNLVVEGRVARSYTVAQGLPSNAILSLYHDRESTLWIGTSAGPAILRDGKVSALRSGRSQHLPVVALGEAGGRVFAAEPSAGVRVFSESTLQELPTQMLPLRDVDALYKDDEGFVWLGTSGSGLYLLDGSRLIHFSSNDGLFDDDVYGIAGDNRGQLWMACSKGIFSVFKADLHKFAAGTKRRFESNPYSPLDGLQTVECKSGVQPAAWRMRNGHISFSTIHGLLVIDPNQIDPKVGPPPVVIESMEVDGRTAPPRQTLDLSPGERNLSFSYTGLSFRSPTRVTFRYKLEGFEHDWIDAGTRREAFYTNLPPGTYRFRVTACSSDGTCNEAGAASESFVLPARFYQRPWFWLLSAMLLAGLVTLGYGVRIQQLKQQFGIVLGERSRIARELHDTLIQGFSGVTMQMQALAARLAPEHKSRLEDIIEDSAGCLREARRSVADLRNNSLQQSGLSAAVARAARQSLGPSSARLKLTLEHVPGDLNLPAVVEYNLVRIAQEAVTNSVRHSGARMIEVKLEATQETVRLSVEDDGSGFVRAGEPAGNHYGLVGMQERARDIGAAFQVASEPGAGTTVSVALPIRRTRDGIVAWSARQSLKPEL